jgi:hypothetical protein
MNEYVEFLKILNGIKFCIDGFDVKGALELIDIATELYELTIRDFEQSEGK